MIPEQGIPAFRTMPARNWKAMIMGIAGIINREFSGRNTGHRSILRPERKTRPQAPAKGNIRANGESMEKPSGAPYAEHPGKSRIETGDCIPNPIEYMQIPFAIPEWASQEKPPGMNCEGIDEPCALSVLIRIFRKCGRKPNGGQSSTGTLGMTHCPDKLPVDETTRGNWRREYAGYCGTIWRKIGGRE